MTLAPDDRFKGEPVVTMEQFLAKWFELLWPHMNDADRAEFLIDLHRGLRTHDKKMVDLVHRKGAGR